MSKFKIQGVGLDTSTLDYDPGISLSDEGYEYIYTSIPANNDYLLGTGIRSVKAETPLIVYTNHLDGVKSLLEEHLEVIGRNEADLLLIDGSCKSLDSFSEDLFKGKVIPAKHCGIQSPVSVEQLADLVDKGFKIEYIALTINPFDFNYEILQWAEQRKVYVIGLNPMGGYLSAPRNINAFSAPYLLSFCATYSDIVLVSGRNLVKAWEDKVYLEGLIGEESDAKYTLKKTIIKPVKDIKQAIFTSVNLQDLDAIIPYYDPSLLLDKGWTEMALGTAHTKMPISGMTEGSGPETVDPIETKDEEDKDRAENDVRHYLDLAYYPKDGDQETTFTVARYKTLEYLQSHYKASDGWSISSLGKIGNSVLMITVTQEDELKGWFIWQKVVQGGEHTFVLIVPEANPKKIIFREILNQENSVEEEAIPNI